MNREQRRALEKKLRKTGTTDEIAKQIAKSIQEGKDISTEITQANEIPDGAHVRIKTKSIIARDSFFTLNKHYQKFIIDSEDRVFTARRQKSGKLICLEEEPRWLFWSGDLSIVNEEQTEDGDSVNDLS